MKDDLISRKAAIDAVKHAWWKGLEPSQYIEIIPSAPAMPLEPLCKFLASYAAPPVRSPLAVYGSLEEAWRSFLTKWMEEQNA